MLGRIDGFGAFSIADRWPFRAKAHEGVAPVLAIPDINGSLLADSECVDSSRGDAPLFGWFQVEMSDAEPLPCAPGR